MLKDNIENHGDGKDGVELSRRSFFNRLAVGAFLSLGAPGIVQAATAAAAKADKNHRQAHLARTSVRLPKHGSVRSARETHIAANHAAGRHKQNGHVHDVYGGKKAHYASRSHEHEGRRHGLIQPVEREPIIRPEQERLYLASQGRIATHRSLAFQNPHTGDKLSLTYFEKGRYLSDALEEISFLLRDFRTGDLHPIDPELLDQLHDLKQMLGLDQPFDVVCGYRSPLTNAQLHAEHVGVANNSFHMHGRAIDIRVERFGLRRIHNAALAMHRGGVGYYPESNFIHLDTGTFRTWSL